MNLKTASVSCEDMEVATTGKSLVRVLRAFFRLTMGWDVSVSHQVGKPISDEISHLILECDFKGVCEDRQQLKVAARDILKEEINKTKTSARKLKITLIEKD